MKRIVTAVISAFLISVALLFVLFFPQKKSVRTERKIIEIWHVDSFEGGKGSRGNFLKSMATTYEKQTDLLLFHVSVLTAEGVRESLKTGFVPDMVSFSCGVEGVLSYARALPYSFAGGMVGERCYAVPWCAGRYFLFCKEDSFASFREEEVLLSVGGSNLPQTAAALLGITRCKTEESVSAYTDFLRGKAKYMLGTQRDVCRFAVRGENVAAMPVSNYADLYQYMAITGTENQAECLDFLAFLLSDEVQGRLERIGMFSAKSVSAEYTLSPFADVRSLNETAEEAERAIVKGDTKILKTFLKPLN